MMVLCAGLIQDPGSDHGRPGHTKAIPRILYVASMI